jgi:hypothetical protein
MEVWTECSLTRRLLVTAVEHAETVTVWEAHRCPRCSRKWAIEAPDGGSGKPIHFMCPPCRDEIRCPRKADHPADCHCNFSPKEEHEAR